MINIRHHEIEMMNAEGYTNNLYLLRDYICTKSGKVVAKVKDPKPSYSEAVKIYKSEGVYVDD